MSQYIDGTVTVTSGSAAVVGSGTLFSSHVAAGDLFTIIGSSVPYVVGSVTDDTHLTLTANYAGTTAAGASYAITTSFTPILGIAYMEQQDLDTATIFKRAILQMEALLVAAPTGWTPRLSKSVAGSADVTLTTVEAGNLIMEFTGALTGNINVIVPAAARMWIVKNGTSGAYTLTVKTPSGTGIAVTQGMAMILNADAANVVNPLTGLFSGATLAAQADQETGTSTSKIVTSGVQKYHPSAAKVWVNFTSITTTTIAASYNVASLTDNGTGDTTVTFTTAFSGNDYSATTASSNNASNTGPDLSIATMLAGSLRVQKFEAGSLTDTARQCVTCFGDQP